MKRTCQQLLGLLGTQQCRQPADAFCNECGSGVCRTHSRVSQGSILCLNCVKQRLANDPSYSDPLNSYNQNVTYQPGYSVSDFSESDRAGFEQSPQESGHGGEFEQDFAAS